MVDSTSTDIKVVPTGRYYVENVIHCKDCKHKVDAEYNHGEVSAWFCFQINKLISASDYCSWASPKDEQRERV